MLPDPAAMVPPVGSAVSGNAGGGNAIGWGRAVGDVRAVGNVGTVGTEFVSGCAAMRGAEWDTSASQPRHATPAAAVRPRLCLSCSGSRLFKVIESVSSRIVTLV